MRVKAKSKKPLLIVAAFALVAALSVGLTSAFLTSSKGMVNTFTPGEVACEVQETVKDGVKSDIVVKNTGTIPAYIRVAVVANTVDAEGNITGSKDVSDKLVENGAWSLKADGYYYCTSVINPGDFTADLLNANIQLSGIQVTVSAQAIQACGVTDNGEKAVKDAWGIDPTTLGSN